MKKYLISTIYNCINRPIYNIEEIKSKIYRLPCEFTKKVLGSSITFIGCEFTLDVFEYVIELAANRTLSCANKILSHLSTEQTHYSLIKFISLKNNTAVGLSGLEYAAKTAHSLANFFNLLSPYSIKFSIYFENNGVVKEAAHQLLESCKNIKVFYDPKAILGQNAESAGYWMAPRITNIYDSNRFYTSVSSKGANNPQCLFNQITNTSLQSAKSNYLEQYHLASVHPLILSGFILTSIVGLAVFGKYLYNKCFVFSHDQHVTSELILESEFLGEYSETDL